MDDGAVSNTFVSDVVARAHRAIDGFKDRAKDEDTLRGVLGDLKIQMVRSIHRISIETSIFEHLNDEYSQLKSALVRST